MNGATGTKNNMKNVSSECYKKPAGDTRNNWVTMMFKTKCNYNCFNVPKKYSVQNAEIMLKSYSAKKMFEIHPGFRKRYPRGSFWSGYEHHESTGLIDLEKSIAYCRSQQQRHGVIVIDDRQQRLPDAA
jgi:hypothetical protein